MEETVSGFGGCTINLVPATDVALFLTRIHRAFYQQRPAARGREHVFVVTPSAGATCRRRPRSSSRS